MQVFLSRFAQDKYGTIGSFVIPNVAHCYILERAPDGPHPRILVGNYLLRLKPVGSSHFDNGSMGLNDIKEYMGTRHVGMLELTAVPGRSEILIHPANHVLELEGCLAPGTTFTQSSKGSGGKEPTFFVNSSRAAYQLIYPSLAQAIQKGTKVFLEVAEIFPQQSQLIA